MPLASRNGQRGATQGSRHFGKSFDLQPDTQVSCRRWPEECKKRRQRRLAAPFRETPCPAADQCNQRSMFAVAASRQTRAITDRISASLAPLP
jgi:hypothetical protein